MFTHTCTPSHMYVCRCFWCFTYTVFINEPRMEKWFPGSTWLMSGTVRTKTVFHLRSKKGGGPRWATDSGECSVELICFDPQAALSIHGMCGGPMLGLFSLGILFPFVNWKVSLPHPSSHFPTETGPQTFFSLLSVLLGKAICLCQKRMGASFYSRTK